MPLLAIPASVTKTAAPKLSQPNPANLYDTSYATPGWTPQLSPSQVYSLYNTTTPYVTPSGQTAAPSSGPAVGSQEWYNQILANDPLLKQANANIAAGGVQNQAQLQAAQARALAQYGNVPSGSLPGVSEIDQTTRDLAAQNTAAGTSTYAQLQRALNVANQSSNASLAARGMLRSGAFGQHGAENLLNYNISQSGAVGKLMDYLQGLYSGYLSQQQQLEAQRQSAIQTALANWIALHPNGITPETPTPSAPSSGGGGGGAASYVPPPPVTYTSPSDFNWPSPPTIIPRGTMRLE